MKRKASNNDEQKYYGIHACLKIFEKRPQDIIRVYLHTSNLKDFGALLKWCAKNKKAYHVVSNEELEKVASSVHHEGVCLLAKEPKALEFKDIMIELKKPKICLLYLDGVQNPHNIGSIIRTCAHFGIPYILGDKLPPLSAAACRIAKGGAEIVKLVQIKDPKQSLDLLKKEGFVFIGTSSHSSNSLYKISLSPKTIFAFGAESTGMSEALMKVTKENIQIPGTGEVESLNVSVATALCIGEYARQQLQ